MCYNTIALPSHTFAFIVFTRICMCIYIGVYIVYIYKDVYDVYNMHNWF